MRGIVKTWNDPHGYGFVASEDGEYFAHIKDVAGGQALRVGQSVEFGTVPGVPGKHDRAVDVRPLD